MELRVGALWILSLLNEGISTEQPLIFKESHYSLCLSLGGYILYYSEGLAWLN